MKNSIMHQLCLKRVGGFAIVFIFMFTNCKKYPENTIWFKNVKNIPFFIGNMRLTKYDVNGMDSLQFLDHYFGSGVVKGQTIENCTFGKKELSGNSGTIGGFFNANGIPLEIEYEYSSNKKNISITFGRFGTIDTTIFRRNLFVDNNTKWEIIKLAPEGTRKIKKTVNDNVYELQFDPK